MTYPTMINHIPASCARAGLATAMAVVLLGATVPRVAAQSDNFNDGNDTAGPAWTHYTLPNIPPNYPPYNLPNGYFGAASYSFPDDGSGGKAYRILAPGITNDPLKMLNARAGSFVQTAVYSGRFSAGTDLLAWNATWRQEAGLIFYFHDINLGTSDGYTATYSSAYHQLYISLITNEVPITVASLGDGAVTLDPTHRYRLVASSHDGYTLLFQLFDKAEPNNAWVSAIGADSTFTAGVCGLFVFEQDAPPSTSGADATFDNYAASTPAAGTMLPVVTDLYPPPAGKATTFFITNSAAILNRDTVVDSSSVVLCLDGVWIPNASLVNSYQVAKPKNPAIYPQAFGGNTVSYAIPNMLPWGSKHTNIVAFADYSVPPIWQTNTWTWTVAYPQLFASNSLPLGSLSVRGFDVRTAQSDNGGTNLANSLARAQQQLAIPPQIPIDRAATSMVQVLDWNKASAPPHNVPGLCTSNWINIAVQSCAYLELTAGVHRFHIKSDDRAGLYSGANLSDPNALVLWENPSSTADATFDFAVEADGLYPIRCLWEETGGSSVLSLKSVSLVDASEVLINDASNPAGVVKAYYPVVCKSSASVNGPYTLAADAANSLNAVDIIGTDCSPTVVGQMVTGGTFIVPVSGATRFYYVDAPRATRITKINKTESQVTITYQVQ